jgi:hypothetical protein
MTAPFWSQYYAGNPYGGLDYSRMVLPQNPMGLLDSESSSNQYGDPYFGGGGTVGSAPAGGVSTSDGTMGFLGAMGANLGNMGLAALAPGASAVALGQALGLIGGGTTMGMADNSTAVDASAEGSADGTIGADAGGGGASGSSIGGDAGTGIGMGAASAAGDAAGAAIGAAIGGDAAGGGGGGGGDCFPAGVPILMADGTEKPIEQVKEGEFVATQNGCKKVLEVVTHRKRPILSIDGMRTSRTHSFLLDTGKWKMARDIVIGDKLEKNDGSTHEVKSVTKDGMEPVFNLEVDGGYTFIAHGLVVHNATMICTELHRRGYISDKMYEIDKAYSGSVYWCDKDLIAGYRRFARPIISLSRESDMVCKLMSACVKPWLQEVGHRAGELDKGHWIGRAYIKYGIPVLRMMGKVNTPWEIQYAR